MRQQKRRHEDLKKGRNCLDIKKEGLITRPSLAESGGFEPADPLTSQQFSRLPQSTTLPTLRRKSTNSS
jgi:hypothetical protein